LAYFSRLLAPLLLHAVPSSDCLACVCSFVCLHLLAATLSTVGYGDITPQTFAEKVYSILAELFGCLLFAMLIGTLGSMMVGEKLLEEKVNRQLAELREFMDVRRIPKELRVRVRRYMELLYSQKSGFDEKDVLEQLPARISQELLQCMYRDQLLNVPMFQNLENNAIIALCRALKPFQAMRGDIIYSEGDVGSEMYILLSGEVELSSEQHRKLSNDARHILRNGAVFGEACIVSRVAKRSGGKATTEVERSTRELRGPGQRGPAEDWLRLHTATAVRDSELKFLHVDDVTIACADNPSLLHSLRELYVRRRRQSDQKYSEALAAIAIQRRMRGYLARRRSGKLYPNAKFIKRRSSSMQMQQQQRQRRQQQTTTTTAAPQSSFARNSEPQVADDKGSDEEGQGDQDRQRQRQQEEEEEEQHTQESLRGTVGGAVGRAELSLIRDEMETLTGRVDAFEQSVNAKLDQLLTAITTTSGGGGQNAAGAAGGGRVGGRGRGGPSRLPPMISSYSRTTRASPGAGAGAGRASPQGGRSRRQEQEQEIDM
jgi:CRP-like cAMP-binding protein